MYHKEFTVFCVSLIGERIQETNNRPWQEFKEGSFVSRAARWQLCDCARGKRQPRKGWTLFLFVLLAHVNSYN